MRDLEKLNYPKFEELNNYYRKYFSLGFISKDINEKFGLISLICYIVHNLKKKHPNTTYYEVVKNLAKNTGFTDSEIFRISIICEDFGYECDNFPTFGLTSQKDIILKIKEIFNKRVPF